MASRIRLDAIVFDAGTQVRAAITDAVVTDYAEHMTAGVVFPPIVLFHDGTSHYIADGFHRFLAAQRNTFRDIDADVRPGTKQDALWFALGANRTNGQRLTEADKKHAILLALAQWPDKSPAVLAEQIGCSAQYVRDVRHQVQTRLQLPGKTRGKDGKMHPVTKPAVQDETVVAIATMVKAGKQSQEICSALRVRDELVGKVRRDLGVGIDNSKAAIAKRRERMRQLAGEGYTSRQIAAAIGVTEERCRATMRELGIDVPADRAVGRVKRHDSNRIIAQIVMDAENLTEGVELIDFTDVDRSHLAEWLTALHASRDKFNAFIRRLTKEQQHGEAA